MTETTVAVCMTVWDVIANALDDSAFWVVSIITTVFFSMWIRHRYTHSRRA